jgi:transposase
VAGAEPDHEGEEASTEKTTTIGLNLAKSVFHVHGNKAASGVVVRRKLRRSAALEFFAALPPALVGMKAYGGAHHWARELTRLGHTVRLMPPAYLKRAPRPTRTKVLR